MCGLKDIGDGILSLAHILGKKQGGKRLREITTGCLAIGKLHQLDFSGLKAIGN